jgi:hypothetical protein
MFPAQNTEPSRYPPPTIWGLIAVNCAIFLGQIQLPPVAADALVFGGPVEDGLGPAGYLLLYFACGVIAALTHYSSTPPRQFRPRAQSAESMRFLGFPLARYIDINDRRAGSGGAPEIAHAARDHKSKVTVFVPHYAMSGGTLVTLAADEIVMCKHSVLGAIDPQFGDSPAASLLRVVEQKPVAEIDDQTLIRADIGRKAIAQVKQAAAGLLRRTLPTDRAEALAEKLATGTWTHDYPIWATTAKELGLPVRTDMPNEVLELMSLYAQPVRTQGGGGVEYLPAPRQKEA